MVPFVPTPPSGTSTTPGWRSRAMRANVSSAARAAAGGIGETGELRATWGITLLIRPPRDAGTRNRP